MFVFFIQICLAVIFIFGIATWMHFIENYVPEDGYEEIYILSSFINSNSEEVIKMPKYKPSINEPIMLPTLGLVGKSFFLAHEGFILLFSAPLLAYEWLKKASEKEKGFQFLHPKERERIFIQSLGILLANFLLIFFVALLLGVQSIIGGVISILIFVSLCASFLAVVRSIRMQIKWKKFWEQKLTQVLMLATDKNNHDLYNQCHNLFQSIEKQPTIPISGVNKVILIGFSAIQLIVPTVVENIERLSQIRIF